MFQHSPLLQPHSQRKFLEQKNNPNLLPLPEKIDWQNCDVNPRSSRPMLQARKPILNLRCNRKPMLLKVMLKSWSLNLSQMTRP
ncbi:MAG: hypothetical protein DWC10_01550 [Candidatus Poseidoniales archaeon]|nr:MAG: hypothetical protein DWC10_01550 [Candidatus Poseidoniales archaeon]